jgi:hypothetical protein
MNRLTKLHSQDQCFSWFGNPRWGNPTLFVKSTPSIETGFIGAGVTVSICAAIQ